MKQWYIWIGVVVVLVAVYLYAQSWTKDNAGTVSLLKYNFEM